MKREIDIEKNGNLLYDFIQNGYDNMQKEREYSGVKLNMTLIHTLVMVYRNPGINVMQVSQAWGHTRSAASKNVVKLEEAGFLEKRKMPDNQKEMCLFVTQKGEEAAKQHINHDNQVIDRMLNSVSRNYSCKQIEDFFSLLAELNDLIREENQK